MMTDRPIQIPVRCDNTRDDETRCPSRNALWDDSFQGNLCIVCKAGRDQAKRRHPAGKHQGDV